MRTLRPYAVLTLALLATGCDDDEQSGPCPWPHGAVMWRGVCICPWTQVRQGDVCVDRDAAMGQSEAATDSGSLTSD